MYCLVLRHLSPIQKGIQSAHAIVEYANQYRNTPEYERWAFYDKTIVMLDVHSSTDLNGACETLFENGWPSACFSEEDLYNATTAVCFLADERIYDYETYGRSWEDHKRQMEESGRIAVYGGWLDMIGNESAEKIKELISNLRIAN